MDSYLPLLMAISFIVGIVFSSLLWNQEIRKKFYLGQGGKLDKRKSNEKISKAVEFPFVRKQSLFSAPELNIYKQLTWAVGDDLFIYPKVRLIDSLQIKKKTERKAFYQGLAKVRRVDFLMCDKKSYKPVMMVTTQQYDDEGDQESLTQRIAQDAGIAHLQITSGKTYAPSELKNLITAAIAESVREAHEKIEEKQRRQDEKLLRKAKGLG